MNFAPPLFIFFFLLTIGQTSAVALTPVETPVLLKSVNDSVLPSISSRLPGDPKIVSLQGDKSPGRQGGQLRLLMGKQKDIRQVVVYGYARLVTFTPDYKLEPDILAAVDNSLDRVFTLHLRKGHKWSDGHPFTSEDFRYYWEDIANNPDLSKGQLPKKLLVEGEGPVVEFLDKHTVRYSWEKPNPNFLTALAAPKPLYIYKPAHYLRQFHKRYQTEEKVAELIKKFSARNWMGVHIRHDRPYKAINPDLPSLQPWVNSTYPPSERFIFKRNPYYHRIDSDGLQLPYIDSIAVNIASSKIIPAKTGTGESDLQGRYLRMDNFTFLKQGEKQNDYNVRLWKTARGAQMALYPNFNTQDAGLQKLIRDVRFRRALSLAIHRHEINQVVYFGLASESNNTVLPESPLFKPEYKTLWADFNLARANHLLDELGLKQRDNRGVRLMSDGRPLEILVQTAGESTEQTDVLELIHDSWLQAGIKLYTIPSTREVFRNRVYSGDAVMSIWWGLPNALLSADSSPHDLAPTSQDHYQWPKWGLYYDSGGKSGEKPDLPEVNRLLELNDQWLRASSYRERENIWHQILKINSEQVYSIGIVNEVKHPVVVNNNLNNVAQQGFYNFDPGAYFGIYKPDTFWFSEERR